MDIKKYEVLLNTLNRGSFAQACEDLGYSQPAITHMMKSMEQEIGFPLLQRSNKGIQLTSEGQEVLPLIRDLLRANDRLNQRYDLIKGAETGCVRAGCFPTVSRAWIPDILVEFQRQHPNIQFELLEQNSIGQLEKWLSNGFIDVAIFTRQPYHKFKWFELRKDAYYALLPKNHPLAGYSSIPASAFAEYDYLACKSQDGQDVDVSSYFRRQGITAKPKYTANLDFTIAAMVKKGLGITMLSKLLLDTILDTNRDEGVTVRPIEPGWYRELGIAVRANEEYSPAVGRFIKCVRQVVKEMYDEN